MSSRQMRQAFIVFRRDLLQLLGVPSLPETLCRDDASNADPGLMITPWQFSSLLRTHVQATTISAVDTLTSISRLVSRIREMPVGKEVVGDVESSVDALTEAFGKWRKSSRATDEGLMGVWEKTKRASALADRAFFNPSMVGLLYFVSQLVMLCRNSMTHRRVCTIFAARRAQVRRVCATVCTYQCSCDCSDHQGSEAVEKEEKSEADAGC